MLNLPIQTKYVLGPLIVLIVAIILQFFEPTSSDWMAYDREKIDSLELWRLISANFLHTNLNHLLLNGLGVILLWALHGAYYTNRHYLILFLLISLGCTLGIYFFAERLSWYVGLSGTLHGFFITGAYFDIRHGVKSGWLLLIGVWLKIAHEQWIGPSADVVELIGADVAIEAHLFGAIGGMFAILYYVMVSRQRTNITPEKRQSY
ncbi:MAG: rhomboid family GlyGly-CTERM serine protease [Paraglaciecola sp.]|jgi:rhomboid family GlyGly-CTERM serine protease